MKTSKSSFGGAILAALFAIGANFSVYGNSYTMALNTPYGPSGYTLAFGGPLYATFTDDGMGEVLLTLNLLSLPSADHVLDWDFNINQSSLLGNLVFTPQGDASAIPVGETPSSSLYTDDNGKYLFDLQLQFNSSLLYGGQVVTYLITKDGGTGILQASDFDQLSTTLSPYTPYSETQPFMSSASVFKPTSPGYNWLGGDVPDGGMTALLLGMSMIGIGSARRFLNR